MRYVTIIGLVLAMLAAGTFLPSQASMYWDSEVPDLETMMETAPVVRDSTPTPPKVDPAPKMYADGVTLEIDVISEDEPAAAAPITTTEDTVTITPQSPRSLQRTLREPAQPSSSPAATPRPAVTQPGGQPESQRSLQDARPAESAVAPGLSQAEEQKPVTKKMRWGQTETGGATPAPQQGAPAGQ